MEDVNKHSLNEKYTSKIAYFLFWSLAKLVISIGMWFTTLSLNIASPEMSFHVKTPTSQTEHKPLNHKDVFIYYSYV